VIPEWAETLLVLAVFVVGLRLSAFFSGSETGFYRLSLPRLSIDAKAGDGKAGKLLWFVGRPTEFVATCLIGNNVANYLCSGAISSGIVLFLGGSSEFLEIAATIVMSPVIFVFGELLPKGLYYMVPYSSLKRGLFWLRFVFVLFYPLTWPIVQLTRLIEWFSGDSRPLRDVAIGRNRLVQLVDQGRREGVLTDLQSRLANGLLQMAPQQATNSMIPAARILGIAETSTRDQMLDFAQRFGISEIPVHQAGDDTAWQGYVMVAELQGTTGIPPQIHAMPTLEYRTSKLEALHRLQSQAAAFGAVQKNGRTLGIVSRNGLIEQLFRPALGASSAGPV